MRKIKGKRFEREAIVLDDTKFIDCVFIDCRLSFSGGICDFTECAFVRPQMEFSGAAGNTVALLSAMGMLNQKAFVIDPS